jgi:hypothetical protein
MDAEQTIALWGDFKIWLEHSSQLPQSALHVIVGIALYPIFAKMMKVRWGSPLPLLPILGLELVNEVVDFTRYYLAGWPYSPMRSLADVAFTMLPIGALVAVFRLWGWHEAPGAAGRPN